MNPLQPEQKASKTLIDYYFEEEKTPLEVKSEEIIDLMKEISESSSPSYRDWHTLLTSSQFNEIKNEIEFQKKLVTFLDEHSLNQRFLALLRKQLNTKRKKTSTPLSLKQALILLIIICILTAFIGIIATSGGFIFEVIGALSGSFLILPSWVFIAALKPDSSFGIQLALAQILSIVLTFIIAVSFDLAGCSWEVYESLICCCAVTVIQIPITLITTIIYWIISKFKKH